MPVELLRPNRLSKTTSTAPSRMEPKGNQIKTSQERAKQVTPPRYVLFFSDVPDTVLRGGKNHTNTNRFTVGAFLVTQLVAGCTLKWRNSLTFWFSHPLIMVVVGKHSSHFCLLWFSG